MNTLVRHSWMLSFRLAHSRSKDSYAVSLQFFLKDKSHGIPVVLLVLEGGPNTIRTALESVTRNPAVPVVIAEGSGRAADILAHAHSLVTTNDGYVIISIAGSVNC
mgnify:FL=1